MGNRRRNQTTNHEIVLGSRVNWLVLRLPNQWKSGYLCVRMPDVHFAVFPVAFWPRHGPRALQCALHPTPTIDYKPRYASALGQNTGTGSTWKNKQLWALVLNRPHEVTWCLAEWEQYALYDSNRSVWDGFRAQTPIDPDQKYQLAVGTVRHYEFRGPKNCQYWQTSIGTSHSQVLVSCQHKAE